jgi:predicted TIM-barrel fold metal-dependent hydrolase
MSVNINRRKFFSNTAMSAAGLIIGNNVAGLASEYDSGAASYNIAREAMKFRKIDSHIHVWLSPSVGPDVVLDFADRLGVERLVISKPVTGAGGTHKHVVEANNLMMKALKQHPDRFIAQFTLLPEYKKESLEELKRCVDNGLVGLKVYYQTKLNDPLYFPIIEKMIDLKMVILMHSYLGLGRGGHRTKYGNLYPNESTPEDFADVARRYPESILQFAHIGGGGDWEYECKVLKDYPNIYVDVSGSNNEENIVNYAVRHLGVDRLFFGSDNCYYQSVSKVLSADITDDQRRKIFFENYNNMLRKGGYNVD